RRPASRYHHRRGLEPPVHLDGCRHAADRRRARRCHPELRAPRARRPRPDAGRHRGEGSRDPGTWARQRARARPARPEGGRPAARLVGLLWLGLLWSASLPPPADAAPAKISRHPAWPQGTEVLSFENLEGIILVEAKFHGTRVADTTGILALDTGAGYLALGHELAFALGLDDSIPGPNEIEFTARPLPRLELGSLQIDQVSPVLGIDVGMIREVTDRPVVGLLGHRVIGSRVVYIDYRAGLVALIPAGADHDESTQSDARKSDNGTTSADG